MGKCKFYHSEEDQISVAKQDKVAIAKRFNKKGKKSNFDDLMKFEAFLVQHEERIIQIGVQSTDVTMDVVRQTIAEKLKLTVGSFDLKIGIKTLQQSEDRVKKVSEVGYTDETPFKVIKSSISGKRRAL